MIGILIMGRDESAVRVMGHSSRVSLENCSLCSNTAERGAGFLLEGGDTSVTGSHVIGNRAQEGAGFYIAGGRVRLTLVLLAENHAEKAGGALCVIGGSVTLSRVAVHAAAQSNAQTRGDALFLQQKRGLAIRLENVTFTTAPNRSLEVRGFETVWLSGVTVSEFDCTNNPTRCDTGT